MSLLVDLMTKLMLWINHTVYRKHSLALEVKITWICLPAGGNSSGCKKKSNSIEVLFFRINFDFGTSQLGQVMDVGNVAAVTEQGGVKEFPWITRVKYKKIRCLGQIYWVRRVTIMLQLSDDRLTMCSNFYTKMQPVQFSKNQHSA